MKQRVSFLNFSQIQAFTRNNNYILRAAIIGFIILLGIILRVYQFDRYPINNLDDGVFYVWAGASFWQNPFEVTSLTLFHGDNPRLFWKSQYLDEIPHQEFGYRLVQPWFDHPPFGAALIGLPAFLMGYHSFENVPYGIVRLPAIIASIFTLYFAFKLYEELFGFKHAALSTLLLATIPYFVFAHRQSYLENMLTPFMLLAVWQGFKVITKKQYSKGSLVIAILASFICGWIKLVGLIVPLILTTWSFKEKKLQLAVTFGLTTLASIGSYILYGLIADAQGFIFTLTTQAGRGMVWGNFAEIITNQSITGSFKDTSLLLAWIATFAFIFSKKNITKDAEDTSLDFFTWIFVALCMVVVVSSGEFNSFIWYRYTLFPFLAAGLAWLILKIWRNMNIAGTVLLVLLGWSQINVIAPNFLAHGGARILILAALIIPTGLYILKPYIVKRFSEKNINYLHHFWLGLICTVLVLINLAVIVKYPQYYCTHESECKLPVKILLKK